MFPAHSGIQHYNPSDIINRTETYVHSTVEPPDFSNSHATLLSQEVSIREVLIWDRKAEGGFPGTFTHTGLGGVADMRSEALK